MLQNYIVYVEWLVTKINDILHNSRGVDDVKHISIKNLQMKDI